MTGARLLLALRTALWVWVSVVGASVALGPLVSSQYYLVPGGFLAGIVIVCGAVLRAAGGSRPVVVLVQVLLFVELVTVGYARDGATLGFLPNGDTLDQLVTTVRATLAHAQEFPPPVPVLHALDATLAVGMGLLTLAVDLLASSRRTVPLVGLVFLTVYMIPVSLLNGQVTLWAFIPGALGYVFLLAATERSYAIGWGHHLTDPEEQASGLDVATRGRGLAATGRRAGLSAVACAAVIPLFVPTLTTNLFGPGGPGGLGNGNGPSDVSVDNPMLDLRRNLTRQSTTPLVRITDATAPPAYLRLTALDQLSDDGWHPGQRGKNSELVDASLPDVPGTAPGVRQTMISARVTLTDAFHTRWLPAIYAPRSVGIDGPWLIDRKNLDIVSGHKDVDGAGKSYTFSSSIVEPTPAQLKHASASDRDLNAMALLPQGLPAVVADRAREVTRGEHTEFAKAMALQSWFRADGGFQYDVSARNDTDSLQTIARFVGDDRRGYCEQFASAMAIMARTLDIPARVAVGFLRPEHVGNTYVFRGTDMHAWPELYFDGVGWVRFEPTPGGAGYVPATFDSNSSSLGASPSSPKQDPRQNRPRQAPKDLPVVAGPGGQNDTGGPIGWLLGLGAILAVLALLAVPLLVRTIASRRRWRRAANDPARTEAAWADLRGRARDLGYPWNSEATPRAVGRALSEPITGSSEALEALELLVLQTERARYDRACDSSGLSSAVDQVVDLLASRASRRRRVLARWLPISWIPRAFDARRRGRGDGSGLIALRE